MADEYQVIGWLFTAKDEATPVAERAQESLKTVAANIGAGLAKVPTTISDVASATADFLESGWVEKVGDAFLAPVDFIEGAFTNVFSDLGRTALDVAVAPFKAVGEAIVGVGQTVKDTFTGVVGDVTGALQGVINFATKTELSFRDIGKSIYGMATGSVKMLTGGLGKLGAAGASAGVKMGGMVRGLISMESITKGFGKGGLLGALLGPLGPLLSLLSPIIDVLVEGLMPAVETFSAIFKTAFTPLFELAEVLAQMLAPLLKEFITPFVSALEVIAVQAAGFISSLFKADKAGGGLASLFMSLGPVIQQVFRALGGLAQELIPVLLNAFEELAPIAIEIVKLIAGFAADILPDLGKIAKKVLPPLVKAFSSLLKAVMPLLPPLFKLAKVLLEKVFGPIMIRAAEWLSRWIGGTIVPFVNKYMPAAVMVVEAIAERVGDFFGNLGKYAETFHILFIKPIVDWFKGAYDTVAGYIKSFIDTIIKWKDKALEVGAAIVDALGLSGLGDAARGVIDSIMSVLSAPIKALKSAINEFVIDVANDILAWDPPIIPGENLADILWDAPNWRIPRLASGGIIDAVPGGQQVVAGEGASAEAVVPLTAEGVADFVSGAMQDVSVEVSMPDVTLPDVQAAIDRIDLTPMLNVPAVSEVVGFLRDIRDAVTGTVAVEMAERGNVEQSGDEWGDMDKAVGLSGVMA